MPKLTPQEIQKRLNSCGISEQKIRVPGPKGKRTLHAPVKRANNSLVIEGDSVIDLVPPSGIEKGNASVSWLRWPARTIYYDFADDLTEDDELYWQIDDAINEFNSRTILNLKRLPKNKSGVKHIYFYGFPDQSHKPENEQLTKMAFLGYRSDAGIIKHTLLLSLNYTNYGDVLHELGHAVGLWHEHMRSDRDRYIKINWDNLHDNCICAFKMWNDYSEPFTEDEHGNDIGYDFDSVMNYAPRGSLLAKDPSKPIMESIVKGKDFPEEDPVELSSGDIATINMMYKRKPHSKAPYV